MFQLMFFVCEALRFRKNRAQHKLRKNKQYSPNLENQTIKHIMKAKKYKFYGDIKKCMTNKTSVKAYVQRTYSLKKIYKFNVFEVKQSHLKPCSEIVIVYRSLLLKCLSTN